MLNVVDQHHRIKDDQITADSNDLSQLLGESQPYSFNTKLIKRTKNI